jgi:hypothetical protein
MEKRNGNKQENEVSRMKLLDKITKWFFNTTKIEVNTDWRLVALDTNRELIDLQEKYQQANQRISDLEKRLAIYEEKEKTKC